MTLLGLILRHVLRAAGLIAVESEPPVGPPASMRCVGPSETGIHHVGWPSAPPEVDRSFHHAKGETMEGGW